MNRLKVVILGLLFWIVFSTGTILTLACQFCGILKYGITGDEAERAWVTSTGQGTDALNNAAWFDGDPRETISSHVGRRYVAAAAGQYQLKPQDRFVWWLTTKFEDNHPIEAIEAPFVNRPL